MWPSVMREQGLRLWAGVPTPAFSGWRLSFAGPEPPPTKTRFRWAASWQRQLAAEPHAAGRSIPRLAFGQGKAAGSRFYAGARTEHQHVGAGCGYRRRSQTPATVAPLQPCDPSIHCRLRCGPPTAFGVRPPGLGCAASGTRPTTATHPQPPVRAAPPQPGRARRCSIESFSCSASIGDG